MDDSPHDTPHIVVWGLGRHAIKNIIPALDSLSELYLYGVCSRDESVVYECSQQWKCKGWCDVDQMLEDPLVDIVYLATPIGLHAPQGQRVLEAGKHLWCEKPLACELEDSEMLVEFADQNHLSLSEGFMYLDHPQFARVARFVQEGEMGAVKTVTCRFGIPILERPGFRTDPSLCGGAFWDVGSYMVSAILALFPNQEAQVLFSEKLTQEGYEVDNEGRVILRFSNGVTAFLDWFIDISYRNEIDVWAERGALRTDKIFSKAPDYAAVIKLRDLNGVESTEPVVSSNHFIAMFRRFSRMLVDDELANEEKQNILRRARVLDAILLKAKEKSVDKVEVKLNGRVERYKAG